MVDRTEQIVCSGNVPVIRLKNGNVTKNIYLHNFCWEGVLCILIKQNNEIIIRNDTVFKKRVNTYLLDNVANLLKKDFKNRGEDYRLSDKPEKLLVYVLYDNNGLEKLPHTLNVLTDAFDQVSDSRRYLKIFLKKRDYIPPPPPPPPPEGELAGMHELQFLE